MSLNRVLELSEANMSEGEYLEVANILRDIHNNTPPTNEEQGLLRYKLFDNTALVCKSPMCECGETNCGINIPFPSIKITRSSIHSTYWEVEEVEVFDKKIKYENFKEFLRLKLKSSMSVDFSLYTDNNIYKMDFKFEKYVELYKRRYEIRYDEDDNMPNEEEIYDEYIKFIAEQISDFLHLQKYI